jgi:hypothetical protein
MAHSRTTPWYVLFNLTAELFGAVSVSSDESDKDDHQMECEGSGGFDSGDDENEDYEARSPGAAPDKMNVFLFKIMIFVREFVTFCTGFGPGNLAYPSGN